MRPRINRRADERFGQAPAHFVASEREDVDVLARSFDEPSEELDPTGVPHTDLMVAVLQAPDISLLHHDEDRSWRRDHGRACRRVRRVRALNTTFRCAGGQPRHPDLQSGALGGLEHRFRLARTANVDENATEIILDLRDPSRQPMRLRLVQRRAEQPLRGRNVSQASVEQRTNSRRRSFVGEGNVTARDVTFLTTDEARPGPSARGFVTGDRYRVSEHRAEEARLDLEDIHRRFGVTRSDRSQEPNEGRAILQLREAAEAKQQADLSISDD